MAVSVNANVAFLYISVSYLVPLSTNIIAYGL
jgi:hypothetical protein